MITAKAQTDYTPLERQRRAALRATRLMQTALERNTRTLRRQMREELATEPPPFKGKRRWTSERQRIFVITKLKREGNLPYRRTHRLAKAWRVEFEGDAFKGSLVAYNRTSGAAFVQGNRVQVMHLDSGWKQIDPMVAKYRPKLQTVLRETWRTVTDPRAGVR